MFIANCIRSVETIQLTIYQEIWKMRIIQNYKIL